MPSTSSLPAVAVRAWARGSRPLCVSSPGGELGELLQFLGQWLTTDQATLDASLTRFVGHPGYNVTQLQADLHRFAFLLRHTDGEGLFTADP